MGARAGSAGMAWSLGAALAALSLAALSLAACSREHRELHAAPETGPQDVAVSGLYPGPNPAPTADDPRAKEYEGNAFHIARGQQLFSQFNCVGCHFHGGGGIGPALMDDKWRYGGKIEEIYASIAQGRPNGMPTFRKLIPPGQIWELAAYVRSLSGNADRMAVGSRTDEMTSGAPLDKADKQPLHGDPANSKSGGG